MRKIASIGIVTIWTMLAGICSAQMSSFPAPPPLPPREASPAPANNPVATPALPALPVTPTPAGPSAPSAAANNPGSANPGATPDAATDSMPGLPPPPPDASSALSGNSPPISAATLNSMSALDDKNTLHPGDRISFRVIEDRDAAIPRIVTDTGEVDFPYVGRLKVEGMTCHQVAVQLKKLLEVDYYKTATVIVGLDFMAAHEQIQKDQPHNLAWIMGQVRNVGPVELSPLQPLTVSQAILRAGGFGDFADQRRVRVIHRSTLTGGAMTSPASDGNDGKGQIVDIKAIFSGEKGPDPVVQPNDYIVVPKKLINL